MASPIVPSRPFDHPAAWTVADLGGKDALAFDLDDRHIAAFEAAVARDRIRELEHELLESIWNGFHLHRFGEQPPGEPSYTPIRIPVFSERDGVLTVILIGGYAWMAADEFDAPFSDRDREALATFERLAADPQFTVSFQLERGEAALFDNCAVLHDRTAFEDHDEPHLKRHLIRLWLMDWDGRPTVEGVRYHKGEGGIVPQGGGAVLWESESGD